MDHSPHVDVRIGSEPLTFILAPLSQNLNPLLRTARTRAGLAAY